MSTITLREQSCYAPAGASIKRDGNNRAFWIAPDGKEAGYILHRTNVLQVRNGRLYAFSNGWETPTTRDAIDDGISALRRHGYVVQAAGMTFIDAGRLFFGKKRLTDKAVFVGYARKVKGK